MIDQAIGELTPIIGSVRAMLMSPAAATQPAPMYSR